MPLCASNKIEPLADTLVVALMRPDWLTAMPTSVVLPRGVLICPLTRLATLPCCGPTTPAASLPLAVPTSTSRPRKAGRSGLISDAYSGSLVGSLSITEPPPASTVWPSGVLMLPAFSTRLANSQMRPPLVLVSVAPSSTRTKLRLSMKFSGAPS